jgi:hypothetical protein
MMAQCIGTESGWATAKDEDAEQQVDAALDWLRPRLVEMARAIQQGVLTPVAFLELEMQLVCLLREFGRVLLERLLNAREGDGRLLPHDVLYEGQGYRRLGKKTRNANVATWFGTIILCRFAYRYWEPGVKESCIFPLELQLGLLEGTTPALADFIGRRMAEAGATQSRVLQQLRDDHGVSMGVKRLRKLISRMSEGMSEHRETAQVDELLNALRTADQSVGNRKPVLAVGRDGITLCEYQYRFFEVATVATVTVFNRAGKRLRTIYLAWQPELGQHTMSRMLTCLLTELLRRWEGPLPTLAYIADSGGNECTYFEDTLRRMRHPRTGHLLEWQRVVDFYHASQRVWTMAEMLFGKRAKRYFAWARRMLRVLKTKPRGTYRVLHSAAALAKRRKMNKSRRKTFTTAYKYIAARTKWMRYYEYRKRHIPIGSGITEAACKTIFTQRLKLSGMRWKKAGARPVLTLRTILLSHTWESTRALTLETRAASLPVPYAIHPDKSYKNAA